jgi:hypothetical protein
MVYKKPIYLLFNINVHWMHILHVKYKINYFYIYIYIYRLVKTK